MIQQTDRNAIYDGVVVHKRSTPRRHNLRYKVFSILLDVDCLALTAKRLRFFSLDRFNLFSLYLKDYGVGDGDLGAFVRRKAGHAGVAHTSELTIRMLTYPRIFGYQFNPLTVYFAENPAGETVFLLYEVHNTFGEKHFYAARAHGAKQDSLSHENPKAFFVSPFNDMTGTYRFTVRPPAKEVFTGIVLNRGGKAILTTYFKGTHRSLDDTSLLVHALAYPFMTVKIIAAIHWEALLLWLKGVPVTLHLRSKSGGQNTAPGSRGTS